MDLTVENVDKKLRRTGDRETTESPLLLKSLGLADSGLLGDENGIVNEAILVSLDLADHLSLIIWGAVVVNDTNTALQCHMNGHVLLGDCVHGGGHKRGLECDALRDGRVEGDVGGGEADVARQEKEVVVCQSSVSLSIHQVVDAEAVAGFILLEDFLGLGEVLNDGRAVGSTVGARHFRFWRAHKAPSQKELVMNELASRRRYSQEEMDKSCLVFSTGRVSQEKKGREGEETRGGLAH